MKLQRRSRSQEGLISFIENQTAGACSFDANQRLGGFVDACTCNKPQRAHERSTKRVLRCESCTQNGWSLISKGSTEACSWYFCSLFQKEWLTQKQKRRTVWRREACPLLCPRRVAGWARGPGDRASHWGSAVCLLAGWKNDNTLLPHSAESLWKLT